MKIKVSFNIEAPYNVDKKDIIEWLEFRLGAKDSMSCNPLCEKEIEAEDVRISC